MRGHERDSQHGGVVICRNPHPDYNNRTHLSSIQTVSLLCAISCVEGRTLLVLEKGNSEDVETVDMNTETL